MHYFVGQVEPVLAAASSGVGERQEGVKGVKMAMVAKFGEVLQPGKRARDEQSAWRHSERVG